MVHDKGLNKNDPITCVSCCLCFPQASCVEYVIEVCVALLSQPDNEGATPLHYAVIGPSSQLPQLLIDKV